MTAAANPYAPVPWPGWIAWFRRELAPFPGRDITTLRLVVVVALVTVTSMTLQVPQLFLSAFFVFFVTKENRVLTNITGVMMIIGSTIAMSFSLFLYRYTFDYPELRIPVMAGLIFTGMFLSRVFFIGPLGFIIGFFAALTQTTAEGAPNTEALVRGLLWLWVALIYPIVLTVIVNQVLLPAHPWDALVRGLDKRLEVAAAALRRMLDHGTAGGRSNPELLELATRGSSALSTLLNFAESQDPGLKHRHASLIATIAASDTLVSATAALEFRPEIAMQQDDRLCAEGLLLEIVRLQNAVRVRQLVLPVANPVMPVATIPHLRELQSAIRNFRFSLVGGNPASELAEPKPAKKKLFVADAFTNPAHVRFALKVTLAAMICYLIYTGLDWPGISTSFVTCCFIALGHTGATMRKGWLRLIGCSAGGLLGSLCIIFLIPQMESIVPLVLLTVAGTALAGWVATGSDRISYAGLQGAFAFYMCLFQGFAPETNFTTIRDRVVGIMLGIVVSSTVFYWIWPEHAIDSLRQALAKVLRSLSRELLIPKDGCPTAAEQNSIQKIRLEITKGLDSTLTLTELMMYEHLRMDPETSYTATRLENMVANTQAMALMMTALLGGVKLEEWRQLGRPAQAAEAALRISAARQLEQIAAAVESGHPARTEGFDRACHDWSQAVAPVTGNDRPRLVRRLMGQIRELAEPGSGL